MQPTFETDPKFELRALKIMVISSLIKIDALKIPIKNKNNNCQDLYEDQSRKILCNVWTLFLKYINCHKFQENGTNHIHFHRIESSPYFYSNRNWPKSSKSMGHLNTHQTVKIVWVIWINRWSDTWLTICHPQTIITSTP